MVKNTIISLGNLEEASFVSLSIEKNDLGLRIGLQSEKECREGKTWCFKTGDIVIQWTVNNLHDARQQWCKSKQKFT